MSRILSTLGLSFIVFFIVIFISYEFDVSIRDMLVYLSYFLTVALFFGTIRMFMNELPDFSKLIPMLLIVLVYGVVVFYLEKNNEFDTLLDHSVKGVLKMSSNS